MRNFRTNFFWPEEGAILNHCTLVDECVGQAVIAGDSTVKWCLGNDLGNRVFR